MGHRRFVRHDAQGLLEAHRRDQVTQRPAAEDQRCREEGNALAVGIGLGVVGRLDRRVHRPAPQLAAIRQQRERGSAVGHQQVIEHARPPSFQQQEPAFARRQLRLARQLGHHVSLALRRPSQPAPVSEAGRGTGKWQRIRATCLGHAG